MILIYNQIMIIQQLTNLGLTEKQANMYSHLLSSQDLSAPELMKVIGETRTNTYMILEKLESLNLVSRSKKGRHNIYTAQNPIALKNLSEEKRRQYLEFETKVDQTVADLLRDFHVQTEMPGVVVFRGTEGLKQIYDDTLTSKSEILLLRTRYDDKVMGVNFFMNYIKKRAELGIKTRGFYPTSSKITTWAKNHDKLLIELNYYRNNVYDEPVEIDVYDSKVAMISFGKETMGVIVESPLIASAMKALIASLT